MAGVKKRISHMTELGIVEHPIRIRVGLSRVVKLSRGDRSKGLRERAFL